MGGGFFDCYEEDAGGRTTEVLCFERGGKREGRARPNSFEERIFLTRGKRGE